MPGAGAGEDVPHRVKTILPKTSPSAIAAKPSRAWSIGMRAVDQRPGAGGVEELHEAGRAPARVPIVEPMIESWRKKMRVSPASSTSGPDVVPLMTMRPPGSQRADRVAPRGPADGLHHRVDLDRQAGAGLEDLVGAELEGAGRAWPRRGWWPAP